MFITFEGLDGTGKTTHIELIYRKLLSMDLKVMKTSEPFTGSDFCKELKKQLINNALSPTTDLYLIYAMRNEHINSLISPALKNNTIVLCDRFIDSSISYLCVNNDYEKSYSIVQAMHAGLDNPIMPDLTILFKSDQLTNRIQERSKSVDRFDELSNAKKQKIDSAFIRLHQDSTRNIHIVNTDKELTIASNEVFKIVSNFIKN